MEFTKEELYHIERTIDMEATRLLSESGIICERIVKHFPEETARKITYDYATAYDMLRTISAKCARFRNK